MPSQNFFKKLTLTALLVGSTFSLSKVVSAQSPFFYYPSASFFSPTASFFESDEPAALNVVLESDDKFATFKNNLEEAELYNLLKEENKLTVLVPTEEAFAALSPELQQKLADPETLEKVLKYHLIIGDIDEDDIKRRGVLTMLEQNAVAIGGIEGESEEVTVMFDDATASEPLFGENGAVIPIDKVLIPANL